MTDRNLFIHIRLEPETDIEIDDFIRMLPPHFQQPKHILFSNISGIDQSILRDNDWAYAWKIHGEASEWVFHLLESHEENPVNIPQMIQFLHFITNPLLLGHKCLCIPAGFLSF